MNGSEPHPVEPLSPETNVRREELLRAAGTTLLIAALLVFLTVRSLRFWESGLLGVDARVLLQAASALLDGVSPYPGFHYPPLPLVALVPLTAVPNAPLLASILALACVPASLWALSVRDWRCYAAALMWQPVSSAVQTANASIFIVLGTAMAWRYRDHARRAGLAAAVAVSAKLISWPLVVWLWATGRRAATGWCIAWSALATVGLAGVIVAATGSSGSTYSGAASSLASDRSTSSYGLDDMLSGVGVPLGLSHAAFLTVAVAVAGVAALLGRRGEVDSSFGVDALATMLAAPNLWPHSFAFLLLALGVMRPRFTAVWLLPIAMYGLPAGDPGPSALARAWIVLGIVVLITIVRRESSRPLLPPFRGLRATLTH